MPSKRSLNHPTRHESKTGHCQVCGDQAKISNYGALTCSSCKTFFRRHGFHPERVPRCAYSMNCSISIHTRRLCTACRFAKCLAVGMCPSLIRKEDLSDKLRSNRNSMTSHAFEKTPESSALLTSSQWQLISNIVHAFDSSSSVANTRTLIHSVTCPSIINPFYIVSSIYKSLQSFIHCTADFRIMTVGEQSSLFHRNMLGLLAIDSIYFFRESGMFDNGSSSQALVPLYTSENIYSSKLLTIRLDDDGTLFKLLLITLLFSSNGYPLDAFHRPKKNSLLQGTFRLFGSQNVYAELTWNYLTFHYGFRQAVKRFDALIKLCLDALCLTATIYQENQAHQWLTNRLAEESERSLTLNEDDQTPLWGKTVKFQSAKRFSY